MTTEMPVLTTQRLTVRTFQPEDLDAAHRILDLESGMGGYSRADRRAFLQCAQAWSDHLARIHQPPYGDRAVILSETGELIGSVGIVPALEPFGLLPSLAGEIPAGQRSLFWPEIGLFWVFGKEHQGKGFATEAGQALIDYLFTILNVRRIIAETDDSNLASQRVMQKLGMRLERNPQPEPPWFQVVGILENPASRV